MSTDLKIGSREVARAAVLLSLTSSRTEEQTLKAKMLENGIKTAAVDYGGEFLPSVVKIIERAVVASKREGLIEDSHLEQGAVAGAAREAISQISQKAMGLSIGGKIAIARSGEHLVVAVFFEIGLSHLNEICVGMGHRAL